METIKEKLQEKYGIRLGNEYAIPINQLKNFIQACMNNNLGILGFEGVLIRNNRHEPLLDWIADFSELTEKSSSWSEFQHESIKSSLRFIDDINVKDIYFIPEIISQEEYGD